MQIQYVTAIGLRCHASSEGVDLLTTNQLQKVENQNISRILKKKRTRHNQQLNSTKFYNYTKTISIYALLLK